MDLYDDSPPATPDWVLTYGDLMSLLLTFFVMMVSMSDLKRNDKFQSVADAMELQFGQRSAAKTLEQPRNPSLAAAIEAARTRRERAVQSGMDAILGPREAAISTSTQRK